MEGFVRSNKTEEQLYKEIVQSLYLALTFSDNPAEAHKAAHDRLKVIDDLIGRGYHGLSRLHQEIQQEKLEKSENKGSNHNNINGKPCVSCRSMVFDKTSESLHNSNHLDIFKKEDKKVLEHFQKKTVCLRDIFELKEKKNFFCGKSIKESHHVGIRRFRV